jgi:predicted RNA-binding protein Jag
MVTPFNEGIMHFKFDTVQDLQEFLQSIFTEIVVEVELEIDPDNEEERLVINISGSLVILIDAG